MKKIIAFTMAAVLCCAMLCACGSGTDTTSITSADTVSAESSDELPVAEDNSDIYKGSFTDKDGNMVSFLEKSDNVEISLIGIQTLEGTANWVDGAMELDLEDPEGETMAAIFYPAEEGTFALKITQSNWDKLKTETLFEGFNAYNETEAEAEALEIVEYEGTYDDGNYNGIVLTKNSDGSYAAEVTFYRLAVMEGSANVMDEAIEMVLSDPNDGEMTAILYPAENGTFTLKITGSTWDLLKTGTEFAGFKAS